MTTPPGIHRLMAVGAAGWLALNASPALSQSERLSDQRTDLRAISARGKSLDTCGSCRQALWGRTPEGPTMLFHTFSSGEALQVRQAQMLMVSRPNSDRDGTFGRVVSVAGHDFIRNCDGTDTGTCHGLWVQSGCDEYHSSCDISMQQTLAAAEQARQATDAGTVIQIAARATHLRLDLERGAVQAVDCQGVVAAHHPLPSRVLAELRRLANTQ